MNSPRARRMIEAIERTPLAVPMALLTAAAAAFLAYAVPAAIVLRGVRATGIARLIAVADPFGAVPRAALMLAAALVAGVAVWWLFHTLEQPAQVDADEDPEIDLFGPEEVAALPAPVATPTPAPVAEPMPAPQLRRADAHPDAPARRPLFAASDLGTPLDDVDPDVMPFGRPPLFVAEPVDDAEILLLDEVYETPDQPEPVTHQLVKRDPVQPEASIAELMARLERGLERRGEMTGGVSQTADGGLRNALEELRRMTAGR